MAIAEMKPGTPEPGSGPEPVLEVTGLTKRYGRLTAVDGISFAVPRGRDVRPAGPQRRGQDDDAGDH